MTDSLCSFCDTTKQLPARSHLRICAQDAAKQASSSAIQPEGSDVTEKPKPTKVARKTKMPVPVAKPAAKTASQATEAAEGPKVSWQDLLVMQLKLASPAAAAA